jgi:signal transduction histidine kinase
MSLENYFQSIQTEWTNEVLKKSSPEDLSHGDLVRQISAFYERMSQATCDHNPALIDAEIVNLVSALTQADFEGKYNQVSQTLKIFFDSLFFVGLKILPADEMQALLKHLIPVFTHAFEFTADLEIKAVQKHAALEIEAIKQKMDKLDRSKSDFIAVAAHELKTPLTLIEGYTLMLTETQKQDLSEYSNSLIDGIRNGAKRLKMIIDDMLDVSLIDNNLLELNFQPVWLNQIFNHLKLELHSAVTERKIDLIIDPFPGFNEMTFGAPDRLQQVFRNILINAIKFTPDNGKIFVEGRKLPGFIEVTIRDTGIGIDPEDQPLIFTKFSRVGNVALHSSGKTKFKGGGPGLGLYIAKGIVESHGGAIWVESEGCDEKKLPGSAFHVIIPMKTTPPDEKMARIFSSGSNPFAQEILNK